MNFVRLAANFIRVIAILQLLTTGLCFVPESVLESLYAWGGLGHLPHLPFLCYVIRGASYCQGAIGVLLWIIGTDVVRYRPLAIATGGIYLVAAPAFWAIHAIAGMPRWWAIMDTVACFFFGATLLVLCWLARPRSSVSPAVA